MSDEKPVETIEPVEEAGPIDKTKPVEATTFERSKVSARRSSRSLFAPVVLIAAGVFFLLDNLGVVSGLDWPAAFRFWPLLLIFLGLNVLVTQLRPPLGSLLSLIVALAAVGVFGYLLLSGSPDEAMSRFGLPAPREAQEESFAITPGEAQTADITLRLSNYPATIAAGDSENLIAGTIWSRTGLDMQPQSDAEDHVEIEVGELPGGGMFFPFNWFDTSGQAWTFSLSPELPLDLTIDAANASTSAALADLMLSGLVIDAGNGGVEATLPDGDYDVRLDGGNGSIVVTLGGAGEQRLDIEGGNGSIRLVLPEGVPARVEYDEGNGSVSVDGRFERVSGDGDEGAYETAGYDGQGIVMAINSGNGSVRVEAP